MSQPKLKLYFDIVSPFGYLAFYVVNHSPAFKDVQVDLVPVSLGAIMKANDNAPPIRVRNKAIWLGRERLRWAKLFSVPMTADMPANFPPNTLHAQRALVVVKSTYPEAFPSVVSSIYDAMWARGKDMSMARSVQEVLVHELGSERATEIEQQILAEETKGALRENTDRAFDNGCFGLPWFEATNATNETESFWGFDHIGVVVDFLALPRIQSSTTNEESKAWRALL